MLSTNPTRPDLVQQARIRRFEARCLKYWRLKIWAAGMTLGLSFSLITNFAKADEDTGLPQDDPKDMSAEQGHGCTVNYSQPFLPLPVWSRFVAMPQLPDQLKPMGHKAVDPAVATAATTTNAAPVPTSATPSGPTPPAVTTTSAPAPKPKPEDPALVAISPFLQWIHDNKDAAAEARKQADTYHAPATPAAAPGSTVPAVDPYWMPPLMDSENTSTQPAGGSAAIYTRPNRD